ncbi:conserved transmembrane protein rich in alanine%2C arginine and proline [Mycobacteroides abscessus]|nr:conserved transmembrane protein rich in alanine%2C arginine and proline [Mycobacteroides abscessus]
MTMPTRAAKPRRGSRRPGWALLTALLVLAIGSGIALVFTDKAIYLRVGLLLALWAAVIASFAALTYRRQSDTDQAKVRDQKLVYDLQLEREISARREYELTVESRLRQQLAGEIEAQAADEIATLRAELAALRTNLEILFNTDLSDRPAIEHDPIRALGPWPGAEPQPVPTTSTAAFTHSVREPQPAVPDEYQDVTAVDEDSRTSEYPIIDVAEDPHHVDQEQAPPTPPYPAPPYYGAAQPHEPEPYQQPVSSGTHWRPQPEPHVEQPSVPGHEQQFPAAAEPAQQPYWAARQEDWDAAADGEDWDPVPAPMAPPEQPAPQQAWNAPAPEWHVPQPPAPPPSAWAPAPAEGQWLPPGTAGSNWASHEPVAPPSPYQAEPRPEDVTPAPRPGIRPPPQPRTRAAGTGPPNPRTRHRRLLSSRTIRRDRVGIGHRTPSRRRSAESAGLPNPRSPKKHVVGVARRTRAVSRSRTCWDASKPILPSPAAAVVAVVRTDPRRYRHRASK